MYSRPRSVLFPLLAALLIFSSAVVSAQEEAAEPAFIDDPLAEPAEEPAYIDDPLAEPDLNLPNDPFAEAYLDPFADPAEEAAEDPSDDPFADAFEDPFADPDEEAAVDEGTDSAVDDFDSMFETGPMIEVVEEEPEGAESSAADEFLQSEGVEFGGKFSGSLLSSWNYEYLYTPDFDITDPASSLTPSVSADLFFNARPDKNYRVYGKLGFASASGDGQDVAALIPEGGLTFEQTTDVDGNIAFAVVDEDDADPDNPDQTTINQDDVDTGDTSTQLNITVKELFADFDWDSRLYFRFGKSTIKWGVGYFWSPTDVLNLTAIDVEDPTADREGPVSLKIHYPFDVHNAYLYLIAENAEEPLDIAAAAKTEFVVGNTEIGVGAYYQRDLAPRLVATLSTTIGDVAVFGEGSASWGADRVFVRPSKDQSAAEDDPEDDLELVLDTYEIKDRPFFSATAGANYMHEFDNNAGSLLLVGQYFFNGVGYSSNTGGLLEAAYRLALNSGENGLALPAAEQPEGYEDPPQLATGDLANFGQHYLGAMVSWGSIFDTDLSFSTLGIMNITDLSGMVIPTLSYKLIDHLSISAGARLTFGDEGDEYTNPAALIGLGGSDWKGPTFSLTLEASVGGGSF